MYNVNITVKSRGLRGGQRCLTTYKVPSLTSTTEHPDFAAGAVHTKMNDEQTQLLTSRVSQSRECRQTLYEQPRIRQKLRRDKSTPIVRGYVLHNPEPKGGVCQVGGDERKALAARECAAGV